MGSGLSHYRRLHLATLLAVAVAGSVLGGALLVGDSVRGSLRQLALARLGRIDQALVADKFFRRQLALDLGETMAVAQHFSPPVAAILLEGAASSAKGRATQVQISGVERDFAHLFADSLLAAALAHPVAPFPPAAISPALQRELGVEVGQSLVLSLPRYSAVHRESLFGRRQSEEAVRLLRCTVATVLDESGAGAFGLRPHQRPPLNIYVPLATLQRSLDQPQKVNALYLQRTDNAPQAAVDLQQVLARAVQLADLGLSLRLGAQALAVESSQFFLSSQALEAARRAAGELGLDAGPLLTYLATTIASGERGIPYSTVAALPAPQSPFGGLQLEDGSPAPPLGPEEILLNSWSAAQLDAQVGDAIELEYFVVDEHERLETRRAALRLRGIVAQEGLAADTVLVPNFPGLAAADDMAAWEAPFPLELGRIRPEDEHYWDRWGAAPKAFVSYQTGQRLWRSRFGASTALWVARPSAADSVVAQLGGLLVQHLAPGAVGLNFYPVRQRALQAAAGATDFGGLFVGFSLFLLAAAALLAGLLFRFGLEQRVRELGLLLAVGYTRGAAGWLLAREGLVVAFTGSLLGLVGATVYAWTMMAGLRTWWQAAVNTTALALHVEPVSLALGWACTLAIAVVTLFWSVRQLGSIEPSGLLAGRTAPRTKIGAGRARTVAALSLVLALVATGAALGYQEQSALLFFVAGAALLTAGLGLYGHWLGRQVSGQNAGWRAGLLGWALLGLGSGARRPGRSLLAAALVASAAFVLVAVAAHRRSAPPAAAGTGGYSLLAEAQIALHEDLGSKMGRQALGLSSAEEEALAPGQPYPFRLLPGEDISCLNLFRPGRPRILGAGGDFIARGGFTFQQVLTPRENPWELLEQPLADGIIPAIGDFNSVRWILHAGLGDELELQDETGRPLRLKLVALLSGSIFQSELLISEAHFEKHFPARSGHSYFLFDTPDPRLAATALERGLADYGLDARSTAEQLMRFRRVEQTYLSTFQLLGGLGLALGTLGLGLVLLRNALERRGELAALRAFGFARRALSIVLLAESAAVLLVGLAIGTGSALLAAAPQLASPGSGPPWLSVGATLLAIAAAGLAASWAAARYVLGLPLLAGLRAE